MLENGERDADEVAATPLVWIANVNVPSAIYWAVALKCNFSICSNFGRMH